MIQQKIYEIRSQKVMIDFDLAILYEVPTKALNQAVKRNVDRFPADFMFRLSKKEWQARRSQFVTASQNKRNTEVIPYAFTEHGVTMELADEIHEIKATVADHGQQLVKIYAAIETLLAEKEAQKTWEERERIGFVKPQPSGDA